jgi:mono/diheme cytochrome c family protein
VTDGKGQMPAWGGVLDAKEMDQLWAYIRSKAD